MTAPLCRPVGDCAVLVEFAGRLDDAAHARVRRLDAALAAAPFPGFTEAVPAYVNILVGFDPLVTDHDAAWAALQALIARPGPALPPGTPREVQVCYDADLAPDLARIAADTGMDPEAVIAQHLAGNYAVFLYGFAPGYAYLAGVPPAIQRPRKPQATRGVPAGSVLIAGAQCLVSTLTMPTGWWIIGRSPTRILQDDPARPFLFDVGDPVRFRRIDRARFDAATG